MVFTEPPHGGRDGVTRRGYVGPMSPSLTVTDCPECRGNGTVIFGTCAVCFAEFFDDDDDLQPWRDRPISRLSSDLGTGHPAMVEPRRKAGPHPSHRTMPVVEPQLTDCRERSRPTCLIPRDR